MTAADPLQPAIIYLRAGLVIGPSGFGFVQNTETARFLAELGVVFLLFDIGLHFSLREIRTRGDDMITLASLQLMLCGGGRNTGAGLRISLASGGPGRCIPRPVIDSGRCAYPG